MASRIAKGFSRFDVRREMERIQRIDVQLLQRSRTTARSLSIPPPPPPTPSFLFLSLYRFFLSFRVTSATSELGINSFILVDNHDERYVDKYGSF